MSNEFIQDREHQYGPDPKDIPDDVAHDGLKLDAMSIAPRGEPPKAFDVRSVYDSRPVQATDFNICVNNISGEGGASWNTTFFDAGFYVPQGLIAVLRCVKHSFDDPPVISARADVTGELRVNGAAYQRQVGVYTTGLQDAFATGIIPIGLEGDGLNTFLIADQGTAIVFRVNSTLASAADSLLYVHFYGQFLLKTGIPSAFEIANPTDKTFVPYAGPPPVSVPTYQNPPPLQRQIQAPAPRPAPAPAPQPAPPANRAFSSASAGRSPVYDRTGRIVGYR